MNGFVQWEEGRFGPKQFGCVEDPAAEIDVHPQFEQSARHFERFPSRQLEVAGDGQFFGERGGERQCFLHDRLVYAEFG